jgi:hypothetical protein
MATTYASPFYDTAGKVLITPSSPMVGGIKGDSVTTTIATTVTNGVGNLHFLMPLPATGLSRLLGFWLKCADLDSNGTPLLDADIIWRYIVGTTTTDVVVYDSSVLGLFSAALADTWIDLSRRLLEVADTGVGHLIFKVGVAAATPASGSLILRPQWI